jgi:RHS repeat-associated protein
VYDAANRLVHVEDVTGSISADYYYDPFGRRLWKDVGGVRTYFFYSEEGLIAEYDASGTELRSYGYKPDSTWTTDPLFLKEGGMYYWYHNDHLGTPQKMTAQDGTVVWSAQYSAFGEADVQVETVTNNLRFPGQFYDGETGLLYNWFRYYDPRIGRYVSADPIGFVGGDLNLYAYVYNNPITIIDPLGLQCKVRLIVHTAHRKLSDQNTFDNVAKDLEIFYRSLNEKNVEVLPREFAETGKEIVAFINAQDDDSILSLDIFSHSNLGGIHISQNIEPQLSPDYKRQLHDWIRDDQDASDAEFMEESYHGLYSDPAAAWGVSVYFNQVEGPGIAYLPEIDFAKFTADAKIEFHGCKTAMELEEKQIEAIKAYVDARLWLKLIIRGLEIDLASIQVTNFARLFSEKLGAAGKVEAKVTGHVGKSGPPEKGPGGNSYQYGHRRVYQNGELIEELY